LDRKNDTDQ
jgi:hypothetical protein